MSGIRCPMCDYDVHDCCCEDRYGPVVTGRQEYKRLTLYILNGTTERIVSGELYELDPSAAMWHETECVEPCMDRMKAMVDEWESEGRLKYLPNTTAEARCKASPPAGCSATHPSEAVNPPHECKLAAGHSGWHTCKHCDFNWTTPPANTMADDLPNKVLANSAKEGGAS